MAKRLTNEQKHRASICFECGCIPNQSDWLKMQDEKGDLYEAVMYMANQLNISEEVVTVEELLSKEELHAVADNYNWDNDDIDTLKSFLNHPLCDAGTAVLLFWKGAGYQALSDKNNDEQMKKFFEELVRRFRAKEFNSYQIAYDPVSEGYVPTLDECIINGYVIPGELFCSYSKMFIDTELF